MNKFMHYEDLDPEQQEDVNWLLEPLPCGSHHKYLALQMGMGKSPITIVAASLLSDLHDIGSVTGFIVCPASIKDGYKTEATAWKQQLMRWGGFWESEIQVIETGADYPGAPIVIVNPELLVRSKPLQKAMFARAYDFAIIDEAHCLKGLNSKITELILYGGAKALIARAKYKWLLSGSAIPNRAMEIFPAVMALCPELIAPYNSRDSFAQYFCGGYHDGHEMAAPGTTNEAELAERLRPFMRRREHAEDALLPCFESDIFLDIGFPPDVDASNTPLATLRKLVGDLKVPHVVDYLVSRFNNDASNIPPDKMLVFTYSRSVTEALVSGLSRFGSLPYYGALNAAQKSTNLESFITDYRCRILVAQMQSAGTGIDRLQLVCNDIVYAEEDWTEEYVNQQIARLWRRGQSKEVNVVHLIAKGTLDDKVIRARLKKDGPIRSFWNALKLPGTKQNEVIDMALEDVLKAGFEAVCAAIDANTAALKLVSSFAAGESEVEETGKPKAANGRKPAAQKSASGAATQETPAAATPSAEDVITAVVNKLNAITAGSEDDAVCAPAKARIRAAVDSLIGAAVSVSDTPENLRAAVIAAVNAVDGTVIKPAKAGLGI